MYPPWFLTAIVFLLGACVGSFLNVVIYRLPKGESVVHPGSHCSCGTAIRWYDNIPILSWFILRGRARCCGSSYSVRYSMVELLTAVLFALIWWSFGPAPLVALALMLFTSMMIAQSFIDLDTMEIPDVFSVGGFFIGLLVSILVPALHGFSGDWWIADSIRAFIEALIGGFIGSALILWIALSAEYILRKEAMGFGDVKLMGAIGAFCGWQGAVFAIFGGALLGTCAVALVMACRFILRKPLSPDQHGLQGLRIPFGPALAGGALLYFLAAQPYVDQYFFEFNEAILLTWIRQPFP